MSEPYVEDVRPWMPADGDTRCQLCGRPNPVWYAQNETWNAIMRVTGEEERAGIVCPTCFMLKAPDVLWSVTARRFA